MRKIYLILFVTCSLFACNTKEDSQTKPQTKIELKINEPNKSSIDKYIGYFISISGPLVALTGIILTLPLLRKKLIENHITQRLENIQKSNSEIHNYNQKLIDEILPLTFENNPLGKTEVENLHNQLKEAYYLSKDGSSDVATLMYLLEKTIQETTRHYLPGKSSEIFSTQELIGFVISVLELANYYSTQVVQVPKSVKLEKENMVIEPLRRFVSHSHITKFKHFKMGVIEDINSAHLTIFSEKVNRTSHPLLMRSAFQIYRNPKPIANLLFINKIYAPLVLEQPGEKTILSLEKYSIYLVGFIIRKQFSSDGSEPKKICDLIYTNILNNYHFVESKIFKKDVNISKELNSFSDKWLENTSFDYCESLDVLKLDKETFRVRFELEKLKESFQINRKPFMKSLQI